MAKLKRFTVGSNKYRAIKTPYNGQEYSSRLEAQCAMWLDMLLKKGAIKEVKSQYKLDLTVNGVKICRHVPDFLVTLNDGRQKFVEAKGMIAPGYNTKKKLTMALYPDIEYLINPKEQELLG